MSEEWLDEVAIEDIPEKYREVVEITGVRAAAALSRLIGGTYYYFPKADKLLANIRNKKIREEFNGSNHKDLARKYDLSETSIRRLIENKEGEDQPSLFPAEK